MTPLESRSVGAPLGDEMAGSSPPKDKAKLGHTESESEKHGNTGA